MEKFWDVINTLAAIGAWIFVVWFGVSLKNLKSITDSLKGVFDSMKSSSEYLAKVQSTAQKLYDPDEVEKVVTLKVLARELEFNESLKQLREEARREQESKIKLTAQQEAEKTQAVSERMEDTIEKMLKPFMIFSAHAALNLTDDEVNDILSKLDDPEAKENVSSFLDELKKSIENALGKPNQSTHSITAAGGSE